MRVGFAAAMSCWLLFPASSYGQRARIPVSYNVGWETTLYPIGEAAPGSRVAEDLGETAAISYALDRYWFILPFWTRKGEFVASEPEEPGNQPGAMWSFVDQSPTALAAKTGLPAEAFRRPWGSYIPSGWLVLITIFCLVKVFSGPPASKRFATIWADPRYRGAIALMLGNEAIAHVSMPSPILLKAAPPDLGEAYDEMLAALEAEGIPKKRADRDLDFALRYLADNGLVQIEEPPPPPPVFDATPPIHGDGTAGAPPWKPDAPTG